MKPREKKIIFASRIAIAGNAALAAMKIMAGLIAGSMAVVADGVDSASDILTSLITLYTAYIVAKPPDLKYPYGYQKADTLATKLLAFIIFFAGAQLAITSFGKLLNPINPVLPETFALYIVGISIAGKLLLSWYLHKTGKQIESAMLIANARNMQNDVVISVSVLLGLVFTFVFKMPVIDIITALLVSFYIMFVAFRIFMETNRELMDGVDSPEVYRQVLSAAKSVQGVTNPHRIRVRKMANLYMIVLDIEMDGSLTLNEAHQVGELVEAEIKRTVANVYDVLLHIEPIGNTEPHEVFGVSEAELPREKQK
ncbi:MAG: cation diffusion facilitator family transporter [Bacteroidales bacterium]|jgi:cation diffusion facilitator family transporter|nr:cation diffusion facilitator family transporter [Bacteroidota bacterium]MCF8348897.1 cation diffusion facilitator family transporter [Bacteroidales bacterium]